MTQVEVHSVRQDLVQMLNAFGFAQADADPTDLRHPNNMYRFKIGTSYGEVTVAVFLGQQQHKVLRVISERTWTETIDEMVSIIKAGAKS